MKQLIIIASIFAVFSLSIVCNPGKPVDTIDLSEGQITSEWVSDSTEMLKHNLILSSGDNTLVLEDNGAVWFNERMITEDTALVNCLYKLCAK